MSLPCLAARALAATGRKDEAMKITDALLNHEPGNDRGYELSAPARRQQRDSRAQTNCSPATSSRSAPADSGRRTCSVNRASLMKAERAARLAIAIDPSDGEEGPRRPHARLH